MRRRGGPTPYLRLNLAVKVGQGAEAHRLHTAGFTFAEVAERLGVSLTTAWRRCRWYEDWTRPATVGLPIRRIPPQRGTRACPRGRPCIPEVDHRELVPRSQRCWAQRKIDGAGCGNWAMQGQRVCRMHGGASQQARQAAARRVEAVRQRRAIGYRLHQYC
ncbi:MAG TPA: hypothetical protein VFO16_11225 [Pseudonocardiaceae bacterium]|nr:hypothetical protein [Pseudonocardiaceae bacterium]